MPNPASIVGSAVSSGSSCWSSSYRGPRVLGPRNLQDGFRRGKVNSEIQLVLHQIDKIYSQVNVDKEYLSTAGFCFGLLDPGTNIVVNSLLYAEARKQVRDGKQLARAAEVGKQAGDMNQLALKSLVAFLTYLFPYLPEAEAVEYIGVAKADPLAAAQLIIHSRRLKGARDSEATTAAVVTALRCAVAAVKIDGEVADIIVDGWLNVDLNKLAELAARSKPKINDVALVVLNRNPYGSTNVGGQLKEAWERVDRLLKKKPGKMLPLAIGTMKRLLLARIHGYYLQALSIFPTDVLRKCYHGSMLMGGNCYGPLMHPVANIIVNTVWYQNNFPTSKLPEVEMISTKCLWRVAARSLYGLVSFLCTHDHLLTPKLALQHLMVANASLFLADPNYVRTISRSTVSSFNDNRSSQSAAIQEAYVSAATAALHPNPHAQKEFLGSSDSYIRLRHAVQPLQLEASPDKDLSGCLLSSQDLDFLSKLFAYSSQHKQQEPVPVKLKKWVYPDMVEYEDLFWDQQKRVKSMVTAALAKFNEKEKQRFELHIICGVNESVDYNPQASELYNRSHVNFLAFPKGKPSAAVLFFAEYDNYDEDGNSVKDEDSNFWCVPTSLKDPGAEQVRCIYCELEGKRIVHPITEGFCGRDKEFEKLILEEEPFTGSLKKCYSNDQRITGQTEVVDWVYAVDDDAIYIKYCVDNDDNGDSVDWSRYIQVI